MAVDPKRVQAVFLAVIEAEDRGAQEAILRRECGDDVALRERLDELLGAHGAEGNFLDEPVATPVEAARLDVTRDVASGDGGEPTISKRSPEDAPRALIAGRYRLLELIGEGGMGAVWMAEQRQPVKRLVALKLIKPGMATKLVLARFEAERQALALMDHPNIAKVLDGGTTESGNPFFVMELVRGIPLTKYCDERRLGIPERLQLFVQICQAVQHAHQKGIIHRDLKPTNILVTEHDGRPVPTVIDFGLAKALQGQNALTENTLFTSLGAMVGTPLYMAPEQVGINALDIDTRSDVYALGVILYELLTGETPLERKRLKEAALEEIWRIIREEEPPKPSTRLSSSDALPNIAACRHVEPARLTRLVRGELDWIVLKSLEKDRARRYETATALASDVQRYLANEPVSARPASPWYRFQKMVQRNKLAFGAAGAVTVAMLTSTIASSYFAVQARQRAAEAQQSAERERKARDAERISRENAVQQRRIAEGERDRAATMLSVTQAERGLKLIEQGDRRGLLHLVEARRTVEHLPEARDARTRLWEGAMESVPLGTVKTFQPGGKATTATFSPDGARLFVGESGNRLTIFDFATEQALHSITLDNGPVWWARSSPNGDQLLVHSGPRIAWWDVRAEPKQIAVWTNGIEPIGWSRDGRWLLKTQGTPTMQLVDLRDGAERPLGAIGERLRAARRVLISDDGKWLAAANSDSLKVFSLAEEGAPDGREMRRATTGGLITEELAFVGDGRWLVERDALGVRRYDVTTGEAVGHWPCEVHAALSPDARVLLPQVGDRLALIDLERGECLGEPIRPPGARVHCVEFSPRGDLIATGAEDGQILLWDGRTGAARGVFHQEPAAIRGLAFDRSGRWLAATCEDGQVRVRPLERASEGARPAQSWPGVRALATECAGRLLVARGGTLAWRDLETGEEKPFAAWDGEFASGAATPDGRSVAAVGVRASGLAGGGGRTSESTSSAPATLRWWRNGDFSEPAAELPCGVCTALKFSSDGEQLAAVDSESGAVHVWNAKAGSEAFRMELPEPVETVWVAIRWSPDGRWIATCGGFGNWQLWDITARKGVPARDGASYFGLSPNWQFARGERGVVDLRDPLHPTDGAELPGELNASVFSADGSLVSVGGRDDTIRVWDTATGKLHAPVIHGSAIRHSEFTPDSRMLVTLGEGGLRYWDVSTGLPIGSERRTAGQVLDFVLTPDGRYVVTVGEAGTTEVWALPQARVSLEEMERVTWRRTGAKLGAAGDFETISAAELRQLSVE